MPDKVLGKLQIPAIGLLAGAALNFLGGLILIASLTLGLIEEESFPVDPWEKFGFLFAAVVTYAVGVLSVVFAPIITYGALKMLKGKNLRLAKTAAVLSVLPLSCFFPLSAIFGIWALVILRRPEVETVFQNSLRKFDSPPPPPQEW